MSCSLANGSMYPERLEKRSDFEAGPSPDPPRREVLGNRDDVPPDQHDVGVITHLIRKAKGGNESARDAVLMRLQPYIVSLAARHHEKWLRQKQGVSDIVQQSLIRVLEKFDSFQGSSSSEFHAWLKVLVLNEIRQIGRRYRRDVRDASREQSIESGDAIATGAGEPIVSPVERMMVQEQLARLKARVTELNDGTRRIVEMRAFQGLTFAQIAERLGKNQDAVAKTWYRALIQLQRRLNDES